MRRLLRVMALFESTHASPSRNVFVVVAVVLNAVALVNGIENDTSITFNCSVNNPATRVGAGPTWQSVRVRGSADQGQCVTFVYFNPNVASQPALPPPQQLLLLLEIKNLQLLPPGRPCVYNDTALLIYGIWSYQHTGYVCSTGASGVTWYLWSSLTLSLYLFVYNHTSTLGYPAASFNLALVAASAINLCEGTNVSLATTVLSTSYAFAPDARYPQIPPNGEACSDSSYTLTIAAANASSQLSVSVLAAPWRGSCWALTVDGRRCNDSDIYKAPPGQTMQLVYAQQQQDGCSQKGTFDGFTVRADAGGQDQQVTSVPSGFEPTSASRGASVTAAASTAADTVAFAPARAPSVGVVAGVSAAAAVAAIALVTGLTVAVVVRRRRRNSRQSSRLPLHSPYANGSSQPSASGAKAARDCEPHLYSELASPSSKDHTYSALAVPSSQDRLYSALAVSSSLDHTYSALAGSSSQGHTYSALGGSSSQDHTYSALAVSSPQGGAQAPIGY